MADQDQPPPVVVDGAQMEKINNYIDTFTTHLSTLCDAECRNNQYIKALYEEYMAAKNNLRDAPSEVQETEKNYYIAEKGSSWYSNFNMSKASEQSDIDIQKINKNLENIYNSIKRDIDYYGSQLTYRRRLGTMLNTQNSNLQNIITEEKNLDSKRNVANRLSTYYANDIEWVNSVFYYTNLRLFYWILVIFIAIRVCWKIYKRVYVGWQMKIPLLVVVSLFIMPSLITPLVRFSIRRNRPSWGKNLII